MHWAEENLANARLRDIRHPLVNSIYLRQDFGRRGRPENVLVIKTNFDFHSAALREDKSAFLDLLADLGGLRLQAEQRIGRFDHIDICPAFHA